MQKPCCMPSVDKARIAEIAGRYKDEPDQLMKIMLDIQSCCDNAVPREAATVISSVTGIPEAKIYSYLSFYAMFSDKPRGKYIIRMCKSAPCHVRGAQKVVEEISRYLGIAPGETTEDKLFTLEYCECIGLCDTAPAMMINEAVYSDLTPGTAIAIIEEYKQKEGDQA